MAVRGDVDKTAAAQQELRPPASHDRQRTPRHCEEAQADAAITLERSTQVEVIAASLAKSHAKRDLDSLLAMTNEAASWPYVGLVVAGVTIVFFSVLALGVSALAEETSSPSLSGYPFFSQWTLASHADGSQNNWPCVVRLNDGRILVVWSRLVDGTYTVVGAFSSDAGCSWKTPKSLIAHEGLVNADPSIVVSGDRVFVTCTTVKSDGINTSTTWCVRSEDNGSTWSKPYEIPMNHRYTCGKTHRGLRLASGTLLMGYSWDVILEEGGTLNSEGTMDLRAGVMRSTDNGETWQNAGDTHATYERVSGGAVSGTDEPAIVELEDGPIYMLMRTGSSHLYEARSFDEGQTWQDVQPSPLRGSNAPAALSRFEDNGRTGIFVVWDNAAQRFPLCAAASFDGGRTWSPPKDIGFPYTGGQASYPSCEQAPDGTLLAVWQHDVPGGRDVRLARFSAAFLLEEAQPEQPVSESPGRPLTIVVFGDSTTAARGPLRTFGTLLSEDLPARGIEPTVVNAGVGGNTTVLARKRFEKDVLAHDPDIVTISFGINDSAVDVWKGATEPRVDVEQYEANLRYFVQTLRQCGATPILMTPNPLAWTPTLKDTYGKAPYDRDDPEGFNVTLKQYA